MAGRSRVGAGTNQETVRRHNLATLLGHVHRSGGISRAQLTGTMGLNRSTIADLVKELEELALVTQSIPDGTGTPGRPSIDVNPASESVCVVAVELGVDAIQVARVGLGGRVLDRLSRTTPASHDPDQLVDSVMDMVAMTLRSSPGEHRLVGIGIAIPGVVTDARGMVRFAPNLGWIDVPLSALVARRAGGVPVRLGNDAELGAVAEHIRGVGRGRSHLVFLSGDVGIGGGVIVNGVPMRGVSGYAGELGHQPFDPAGTRCRCGNVGCWETAIGSHAVAAALGRPYEGIDRLGELLRPGGPVPPALHEVGRALGAGLGGLVNVFNPELIILGGILRFLLPLVGDDVRAEVRQRALAAPGEQAEIVLPALGGDSVVVGAAELAFSDLLHDPVELLGRETGSSTLLGA